MPTIQKVVLFKKDNIYRARPAYLVAEPDDTVRFLNFADATIELVFPDGVFGSGSSVASGAGWEATVPSNATAGRHVYIGNVGGTSMTVEGESSPEIIIDRFSSGQPIPKISAR